MLFGLICDIEKVGIEVSNWRIIMGFERQIRGIRGKTRCAIRKGGVPDLEFEVGRGSADGDGGAETEIEGRKSRPRSADGD